MNKGELIDAVQSNLGGDASRASADAALNAVVDSISGALAGGDSVQIIGFGTFSVVNRAARDGINPQTGAKIRIQASKGAKFKPGAKLKSSL